MQFKINGYKLFRRDRNRFGRGLMFYLNEEIPCKFLNNHPVVPNAEIICIKCHQLKRKWLLRCYKPPTQSDLEFIASVTNIVDFYLQKFENLFIIGDLNMTTENIHLNDLLQMYDLTAYKKANLLPNCLYHFLTKREIIFKY